MAKDNIITRELFTRVITALVLIGLLLIALESSFLWNVTIIAVAAISCTEWLRISENFSKLIMSLGLGYIITTIACIADLRQMENGTTLVLFSLSCVIAMDVSAYFGGKRFGKTPLAPKISPKKTIEGLLCGLLCASLVGAMWAAAFSDVFAYSWLKTIIYAVVIAFISQGGDLLISYFKRKAGVKDCGTILPGHGGLLDRIDGHLAGFLMLYILISFFN